MDSHSRSDAEIEKKWIPTVGRMKELMDSHSRSDAEIAKVDSHSRSDAKGVLFGQFLTL